MILPLTKETFKKQSPEFRIGAIISDGMWYSLPKWRKLAKVTEDEINNWIDEHIKTGELIQSSTGAKSYRFPLKSIINWYVDNNIVLGKQQLLDFIFPPRIWDHQTEAEGFEKAPLREIGIVSFVCSSEIASTLIEKLRGVAKVRESEPGKYKAYCLNSFYTKKIVEEEFKKHNKNEIGKVYARSIAKRREMVDFSRDFSQGMIIFYKNFGKSLVKNEMETIKIFLPEYEDQESQMIMWVITAIEKFDESTSVPFSGYLNSVLKHWPYDLPYIHLGKDLSSFQRLRSKTIEKLKKERGLSKDSEIFFSSDELAKAMNMPIDTFNDLEEKHEVWNRAQNATTLTWDENSDEKMTESNITGGVVNISQKSDIILANRLSFAIIQTAIETDNYSDAFLLINEMDNNDLSLDKVHEISESFVQNLGVNLGME